MRSYGTFLGRAGYVCVVAEYRPVGEAKWPAQIHDVKAALRWMRANAAHLGIDSTRICVSGYSVGAHLALMVAGTPNMAEFEGLGGNPGVDTSVAACISAYAQVDLKPGSGGLAALLLGDTAMETEYPAASPIRYVSPTFPPTLLIHGGGDEVVPAAESLAMYEALQTAGALTELVIFKDEPHGFDVSPTLGRQVAQLMEVFLRLYVQPRMPVPR